MPLVKILLLITGSFAHGSFFSTSGRGTDQYLRVNVRSSSGQNLLRLRDGNLPTLPYDGYAIVKTQLVSNLGNSAQFSFVVQNIGGSYSIIRQDAATCTDAAGNYAAVDNPLGIAVQVTNANQDYVGTMKMTMTHLLP